MSKKGIGKDIFIGLIIKFFLLFLQFIEESDSVCKKKGLYCDLPEIIM